MHVDPRGDRNPARAHAPAPARKSRCGSEAFGILGAHAELVVRDRPQRDGRRGQACEGDDGRADRVCLACVQASWPLRLKPPLVADTVKPVTTAVAETSKPVTTATADTVKPVPTAVAETTKPITAVEAAAGELELGRPDPQAEQGLAAYPQVA